MASVDVLPTTAPANGVPGPEQGQWTYRDYAAISDDGKRYEVVDGVLYMTPAPNVQHQNAVAWITTRLRMHIDAAGLGKVYPAPFDVRLPPNDTVVQPDVVVVLNAHREIITTANIVGTPDLVVEVSSPSTATYDRRTKMDAYARAGVPEYWIADPYAETVECLVLEDGQYKPAGVFQDEATIPSRVVPQLPVKVKEFFA